MPDEWDPFIEEAATKDDAVERLRAIRREIKDDGQLSKTKREHLLLWIDNVLDALDV